MTVLEKTVVGVIGAVLVAAISWGATEVVDARTQIATLGVRVVQLESHGDPSAHLASIEARLEGIRSDLAQLRGELQAQASNAAGHRR